MVHPDVVRPYRLVPDTPDWEAPLGLREFQDGLGYRWRRPGLLREALTHSSWGNLHGEPHNERLEFLGDSVLDLAAADLLMVEHPDRREGFMSQRRESLVRGSTLALHALRLRVDRALRIRNEAQRGNPGILADALEALVGALYRDLGDLPEAVGHLRRWRILHA